jgi:hypothetical protein
MKLPRTIHIEGSRCAPGKSDPESAQFPALKNQFLVVEEKVDGSGVSIFLDNHLNLQIWHRGSPAVGKEYWQLHEWANNHWEDFACLLGERYMLFGEWMHDKHTIFYDKLPHFFLESDIYDKEREVWLSTSARNNFLKGHNYIKQVPVIAAFKPSTLEQVTGLVGKSIYISSEWEKNLRLKCIMTGASFTKTMAETENSGLMEGLYIKQEDDLQVVNRYKFVRYDFLQKILNSGTHLRDRMPVSNMVSGIVEHTDGLS